MNRPLLAFTLVTTFGVCSAGVAGFIIYRKWRSRRPPNKWQKVGNVRKLYAYPLKSGRYIELENVECTQFGFSLPSRNGLFQLRDRSFVVYGEEDLVGKSARVYPSMVLIAISTSGKNNVSLEAPGMDILHVEVPIKSDKNIRRIKFQNWSDEYVPTIDCGDKASKWLSQHILQKDAGLRLGYHDVSSYRSLNSFKDKKSLKFYKYVTDAVFGLYADLAAALLVNEKSVMDLNEKLDKKVTTIHFRPNIVVDGPELVPFSEDEWFWLKIGDVIVRNVKDCTRCVLTTVDPETGVRDMSREPLKTLSKYRISKGPGKGPIMGVNLEVVVPGTISIEDEILAGIEV